jgi:hypothetical protein
MYSQRFYRYYSPRPALTIVQELRGVEHAKKVDRIFLLIIVIWAMVITGIHVVAFPGGYRDIFPPPRKK